MRCLAAVVGALAATTLLAVGLPASAHPGHTQVMADDSSRCLVPLPEGEGIGGHLLGGPKAACPTGAPLPPQG
jgi:hypothetical protein